MTPTEVCISFILISFNYCWCFIQFYEMLFLYFVWKIIRSLSNPWVNRSLLMEFQVLSAYKSGARIVKVSPITYSFCLSNFYFCENDVISMQTILECWQESFYFIFDFYRMTWNIDDEIKLLRENSQANHESHRFFPKRWGGNKLRCRKNEIYEITGDHPMP